MIDTHEAKSFRREELSKHRILMTNQDAKLVLSAYRPNGADARDPFFEQALQLAKLDPELMEWFEKQRAFDGVIVAKLRTIEPPTGLNSQILAGLRAVRVPRHSVSPWFAVAAALLVAMMVLTYNRFLEPSKLDRLDQFCSDCLAQFSSPVQFDLESPDLRETQKFIRTTRAPAATAIPDSVATMPTAGCKIFRWKGQWVSLTCFKLPSGKSLLLFVIGEKAFDRRPIPTDFKEMGGWHVKFDEESGQVILWASRASMDEFKSYL
jgi:hypothetical protein